MQIREIEEIVGSKELHRDLRNLANSLSFSHSRPISVNIIVDANNETTAFTNGEMITMNLLNNLIVKAKSPEEILYMLIGLEGHEIGHINYNDFPYNTKRYNKLKKGSWYPKAPTGTFKGFKIPNFNDDLKLFNEMMGKCPSAWNFVSDLAHNLQNIIDDEYVEYKMCKQFPGNINYGIKLLKSYLVNNFKPYEEHKGAKIAKVFSLILQYIRFGDYLAIDKSKKDDCIEYLEMITPLLDMVRYNDNWDLRYNIIDSIIVTSFKFWKEELEEAMEQEKILKALASMMGQDGEDDNSKNENGNNSSSGSMPGSAMGSRSGQSSRGSNGNNTDGSKESSNAGTNQSDSAEADNGGSNSGSKSESESGDKSDAGSDSKSGSKADDKSSDKSGNKSGSKSNSKSSSDSNSDDSSNQVKESLEKILNEIENEASKARCGAQERPKGNNKGEGLNPNSEPKNGSDKPDLNSISISKVLKEIRDSQAGNKKGVPAEIFEVVSDSGSSHNGIKVNYHIVSEDDDHYDYATPINIGKVAARRIQNIIAQKPTIKAITYFGSRFKPNTVYRQDFKHFEKAEVPFTPSLCVGLYIDESGSMSWGGRIEAARQTAMCLAYMCNELNIPTQIIGHSTTDNQVDLYEYSAFDSLNKMQDIRKMSTIRPRGANRDGLGLAFMIKQLVKRNEAKKLLFVISDGQPNHTNYGGEAAMAEMSATVKKAKSQNVEVIAAAIGSDKEHIRRIYGEGYLDITELNTLPDLLARIIRNKFIV